MGSLSSPKFPVIDFGEENLKRGTSSWISTCKKVVNALEEYGLFEAVYKKVPLQLHNDVFGNIEKLFDLPVETKSKNFSTIPFTGYSGNIPEIPVFEGLGIPNATDPRHIQDFTDAMWADQRMNDTFSKTLLSYTKLLAEIEQVVMTMLFESYGITEDNGQKLQDDTDDDEDHDDQGNTYYLFRMMKYRVPKEDELKLGCFVHTDKYMINVLCNNQVSGLEIQTKDGRQWIGFHPPPSSFTVLAGESLLAWSNGRIHPPVHRVLMHGSEVRYSVALFCGPRGEIKAPEKLIDDEHPLLFKPFDMIGLLRYFGTEEGRKQPCYTIRGHCGIPKETN